MIPDKFDWLSARELADALARSETLAKKFVEMVGPNDLIVDLACGTGANYRYLDRFFSSRHQWLGIDFDPQALQIASQCLPSDRASFRQVNLASELQQVPAGAGIAITASAFLDITSEDWLAQLASHCRTMPLLISMSVVGQPEWQPSHDLDELIRQQIERHQRSDHGFGPSLGPDAAGRLAKLLGEYGCQVTLQSSDWVLDFADSSLVAMLIGGVSKRVQSFYESNDLHTLELVQGWEESRRNQLQQGNVRVTIRHLDLLSLPTMQ
ncbi:MAG: class I SAM-dependent methyltransferase [Planctomycetales bacterium]|nr:class I SAM-dependent methyltransferase [Planctomycetales bacterium]